MFGHLQLVPTDIIPLVNLCWDDSFANVRTNKKAIVERGWAPFNRNLLLNKEIRATMIENDVRDEKECNLVPKRFFQLTNNEQSNDNPVGAEATPSPSTQLNYNSSIGMHVVTTLLGEEAKLKGREKLKEMRDSGVSMNLKYKNCKQITSAQIIRNTGNYGCNAELVAEVRRRRQVKIHEEQVKQQKKDAKYFELCRKADEVLSVQSLPELMTVKQLKEVLAPLKVSDKVDGAMPKTKGQLVSLFHRWTVDENRRRKDCICVSDAVETVANTVVAGAAEGASENTAPEEEASTCSDRVAEDHASSAEDERIPANQMDVGSSSSQDTIIAPIGNEEEF